jgi:[ribosomal protein S5]-alanine N-acetyltransferase
MTAWLIRTERLALRELDESDDAFILDLLNQPSFIRFIGDKGVRSLDDARAYIRDGPVASYAAHGHGLYRVALLDNDEPIGICGLLKRPHLEDPDIGFAFLPAYWSQGYALEAARAVVAHSENELGITRFVAIASPDNASSAKLLGRIGLTFERLISTTGGEPDVALFTMAGT